MNITLKIHSKSGVLNTIKIPVKGNKVVTIQQPKEQVNYELIDQATNAGPDRIFAERKGNDLHIAFEKDQPADLIIKDYYAQEEVSPVIGLAEDGSFYSYVAENGVNADYIPFLKENVLAAEVLGGSSIVAPLLPFNWLTLLGGLAAAGLVAAVAGSSGGGSGGGSNATKQVKKPELSPYEAATGVKGGFEFPLDKNVAKYTVKLTTPGSTKPTTVTLEQQPDGSWKSSHPNLIPDLDKNADKVQVSGDKIKDNTKVTVTATDKSGATAETEITVGANEDLPLEITKVTLVDTDNDGVPDKAIIEGTTKPNADVTVTANGEKVAKILPENMKPSTDPNKPGLVEFKQEIDLNGGDLSKLQIDGSLIGHNPTSVKGSDIPANNIEKTVATPNNTYVAPPVVTEPKVDNTDPTKPKVEFTVEPPAGAKEIDININKPDGTKEASHTIALENGKPVLKDENGKVTHEFNDEGKPVDKATGEVKEDFPISVKPTPEGKLIVGVPADSIPAGGNVTATAKNQGGDESAPSAPIDNQGQPVELTETTPAPTLGKTEAKDTSISADKDPEVIKQPITTEPNASVTAYVKKDDGTLLPIASGTADENGNLTLNITDPKGKDGVNLKEGDEIIFVATAPGKKPSVEVDSNTKFDDIKDNPNVAKTEIPAVADGQDGHSDTLPPEQPTITLSPKEPGKQGGAEVDASKLQPNETLKISYTDKEGNKQTLEVTKGDKGLETKPSELPEGIKLEGDKVVFTPEALKDNTPITAVVTDVAGNSSTPVTETTDFDQSSATPVIEKITPINTDSTVDDTAEKAKIELSNVKPGDKVTIKDQDGNPIAEVTLEDKHFNDAKDKATVEVDLSKDTTGVKVSVTEKTPEGEAPKGPSAEVEQSLPKLNDPTLTPEELAQRHPNDNSVEAPKVSADKDNVKVAFDPKDTDTLKVTATPTDPEKDGAKPVEAVYKKQPNGDYKLETPVAGFPQTLTPDSTGAVTIPRTAFPKNGSTVTVEAKDPLNHTATSAPNELAPITEPAKKPTVESVVATDTGVDGDNTRSDNNPETFTIKGKAEPGATVTAKDPNGNELGSAVADKDGNYTIQATEKLTGDKPFDITDSKQISVVAEGPNGKRTSDPTTVPSNNGELTHDDITPPKAEQIPADNKGDTKFKVDPDAQKVTVEYTDENGQPKKEELTRDPATGKLTAPKDSPIVISDDGNSFTLPNSEVKHPSHISVLPEDAAGNKPQDPKGEEKPLVVNAGSNPSTDNNGNSNPDNPAEEKATTTAPSNVTLEGKDTSVPADGTVDETIVKGKVENENPENTYVTIKQGDKVLAGPVKLNPDNTFEIPVLSKDYDPTKPLEITAEATGKAPSKAEDVTGNEGNKLTPEQLTPSTEPTTFADTIAPNAPTSRKDTDGNPTFTRDPETKKEPGVTEVTYTPKATPENPNPAPVTVTVDNKTDDVTDPSNPAKPVVSVDPVTGEIKVDRDAVQPGTEVTATAKDKAGNTSEPVTEPVKEATATPIVDKITAKDTNVPADGTPDELTIEGTVPGAPKGTPVEIRDPATGEKIGEGVVGDNGKFTATVEKPKDSEFPKTISVVATEPGKDPSEPATTPETADGTNTPTVTDALKPDNVEYADNQNPDAPKADKDDEGNPTFTVEKPTELKNIEVEYTPKDGNEPVKVNVDPTTGKVTDPTTGAEVTDSPVSVTDGKVTLDKDQLKPNTDVEAKATDKAGNSSNPTTAVVTPDNNAQAEDNLAKPNLNAIDAEPNQGAVEVDLTPLDAEAPAGTKVVVSYDKTGDEGRTTVTFTKQPNGLWTSTDSNIVPVNGKAIIPASIIEDNTKVTAYAESKDGSKQGETAETTAGYDPTAPQTAAPTDSVVTPVNTKNDGTNTPDQIEFSGKAPAGSTVEIKDKAGNPIVTTTADENGNYNVRVPAEQPVGDTTVGELAKDPVSNIKIVASNPNNPAEKPSEPATPAKNPELADGAVKHDDDKAPTVDLERKDDGSVAGNVSPDTKEVVVKVGDEEIKLVRDPQTGALTPADPKQTDKVQLDPSKPNEFVVPAETAKDKEVSATPTDTAGNPGATVEANPTPVQPEMPTEPTKLEDVTLTSINKDKEINDNPEIVKVTGKTDPFADVVIKDKETGKTLGTGKADKDGNFEVEAVENGVDLTKDRPIIVEAKADGKQPTTQEKAVPEVANTPEAHPNNTAAPVAPTIGEDGSIEVPETAKEVDVVVTDPEGNKTEITIPRNEKGELEPPKDSGFVVDPTNPNKVIPAPTENTAEGEKPRLPTGTKVEATAKDELDRTSPKAEETIEDRVPENPTINVKDNGSVEIPLPENAQPGDKTVVTHTPAPTTENPNPKPITTEVVKQPDGTWAINPTPAEGTEPPFTVGEGDNGKPAIVIPADKIEDGSDVIVHNETKDGTPSKETAEAEAKVGGDNPQPAEPTNKLNPPVIEEVTAVDTREGGDRTEANPDRFLVTGKVEGAPEGTPVEVKVDGVVVAKGKTDKDGNFSVPFTDEGKADIKAGSQITVEAKDPANPANNSEASEPKPIEADNITRADNTAPTAEIAPTDKGATVTLDPNGKPGDTATVKVETNGQPAAEHTYKVNPEGKWEPVEPTSPKVNPDNTVDIPAVAGSTVSVDTADTAGNKDTSDTVTVPDTAPKTLEKTPTPENVVVEKLIDKDPTADGNPDKAVIKGNVPNTDGIEVPVEILDEKGNVIGEGKTDKEGNFNIEADIPEDKKFTVVAKDPSKQPSEEAKLDGIPANTPVEYVDNTPPAVPTVTANPADGSVSVALDPNAAPGDVITVKLTPEGSDKEVPVTLTRKEDGSWTSNNPDLVPNAVDGQTSVVIPETALKDNTPVTAQTTDVAGNTSPESKDNAGEDKSTQPPVIESVIPYDLSDKADTVADKVVIKGKVEGEPVGTEVTIFDKDGNPVATVTTKDPEGNFEATLVTPNAPATEAKDGTIATINPGDTFTATAKAPSKPTSAASEPEATQAIPAGTEGHPSDKEAPQAPTLEAATAPGDGSVALTFPEGSVAGDKVKLDLNGDGNPDVIYTKQPDGAWNPTPATEGATLPKGLDTPVAPTAEGKEPTVTIPEEALKDGDTVKATTEDVAGKESPAEEAVAPKDKQVSTPVLDAPIAINDEATPTSDKPTKAVISGTADEGSTVKLVDKDGNPVQGVDPYLVPTDADADDKGPFKFEVDLSKLPADKGPYKVIAEKDGEAPSEPATVGEIPTTLQPGTPAGEPSDTAATPNTG
ncbi:Ig-like domain-containing protein, partial [Ursidibacter arcticus]